MQVPDSQPGNDEFPEPSWIPIPGYEGYWPATFRLAGFGGAAVFLRSLVVPDPTGRVGQLAVDQTMLTPVSQDAYLRRPVGEGFVERLSEFFLTAAADWYPENSVPSFQDAELGVEVSVVSSTETRVGLLVRVVEDLEADVAEFDGMDFETSRSALAQAALDVRDLGAGEGVDDMSDEPPTDWS